MARCNGCSLREYRKQYGKRLIKLGDTWYVKGEPPLEGQGHPYKLPDGTPVQFVAWFMSEDHSYDQDCREGI